MDLYLYGRIPDRSREMTVMRYTVGFVLSLLLSLVSYYYVILRGDSPLLLLLLGILAITQMIVQLVYFLHLGDESRPRWKQMSFIFMFLMLLIIVVGSLWIMSNLDHNMMNMSPAEKTEYMMTQHDKGF